MTRDDPSQILATLLCRVPVHAVDVPTAQRAGDAAVAYASAMAAWCREAAQAVAAAMVTSPGHGHHAAPDAFARIATASALTQQAAE
ncbi:hypothetical protein ASG32_26240 [Methylobacterium sp. Leaf361]|nr:hypothetical protein ASG32_26240 [Methylobacterium sp. Leaf361]